MTTTLSTPTLRRLDVSGTPRALVLMLHGGKEFSQQPVDGRSASWRRSAAMQRSITPALHDEAVSTWLVGYRERGWNGDGAVPVEDAGWALAEVRRQVGDLPVVLLGHSMGARAAVHAAGSPAVVGVVALAPWFPRGESVSMLSGRHLRAAHGRSDRITSFTATTAYVERARRVAASAEMQDMGRVGHYLLKRAPAWNEFATSESLGLLSAVE